MEADKSVVMDISALYRQYAKECLRWAREAKTNDDRQQFLAMAQGWIKAAALQDRNPLIARAGELEQ